MLRNSKHEMFACKLAAGQATLTAYAEAGYEPSASAASRLARQVRARVEELRAEAMRNAADTLAISAERVLKEYARIAFADIRKCVAWIGELVTEEERPDGGDILTVKHMVSNHVRLKSAAEIDDDIAAAIAEVRHSNAGGLSVKLYPKLAALDALADHLGIAKPQRPDSPDQNENLSDAPEPNLNEAARRIAFTLARAQRSKETDDTSDT